MNDTCAAIATPCGTGAVSVIRVSGDDAFLICDRIFVSRKNKKLADAKTHTVLFGDIVCPKTGRKIDEVLALVFRAPSSFTGENTVEINCHGGMVVTSMVLEAIINAGARIADRGEFSKRAFLNGKMDLSKAENIIDIINAKTDDAVFATASGDVLAEKTAEISADVISLASAIMAKVDFPDEDIDEIFIDEIIEKTEKAEREISALLTSYKTGRVLKEGINASLIGRPNVGKSSFFNCLSRENRAIVTEIPGTTRDVLVETINIAGIPVILSDTAGIRETTDKIEEIGVSMAKQSLKNADLIFALFDSSEPLSDEDLEIISLLEGKNVIYVLTKCDMPQKISTDAFKNAPLMPISSKTGEGMDELFALVKNMFISGEIIIGKDPILMNLRQKEALSAAKASLISAKEGLLATGMADIITIDLTDAIAHLGSVSGLEAAEEIVSDIFSRFCLGK